MEIYDTEEEQVEALKKWWQENGTSTIVGIVMGIAIILGWNYWRDYKKAQANEASASYQELLKALDSNNNESADQVAGRIEEQFKGSEYAALSRLFQAKLKVEQGDFSGAEQILKEVAAGSDKYLSNIAKIRLVRLLMASGQYEQGLQVVNGVDAKNTGGFSAIYDELVGDLYVALDRLDEARTAYQKALREGAMSPLLQFKIDDLTAPEKLKL